MYRDDHLEIWNLTHQEAARNGAQDIFNLVGRFKRPGDIQKVVYSLNGREFIPVFFNIKHIRNGRLERFGDFNIDTIATSELKRNNQLNIRIGYIDGSESNSRLDFIKNTLPESPASFQLNLNGIKCAEEVGQIVDGKWLVTNDEKGRHCLEIKEGDVGLDRIILFGNNAWKTSYKVSARIMITKWASYPHNVGLVFKWNPHLQGDGTHLPTQWSTGLAYFCSGGPGLRIRFGVNVHIDKDGKKQGDYILKERMLSPWRRWIGRNINRISRKELIYSQMKSNVIYNFQAVVHPDKYTLTVWEEGRIQPRPQILISNPSEKLETGSIGAIAHRCAMRLYDFSITPL